MRIELNINPGFNEMIFPPYLEVTYATQITDEIIDKKININSKVSFQS